MTNEPVLPLEIEEIYDLEDDEPIEQLDPFLEQELGVPEPPARATYWRAERQSLLNWRSIALRTAAGLLLVVAVVVTWQLIHGARTPPMLEDVAPPARSRESDRETTLQDSPSGPASAADLSPSEER